MLLICFIFGYVTSKHRFGIDHASRCSKSKRTNIVLELKEFLLSLGCLKTSKRGFVFAPREGTWNEVLRMERKDSLVNAKSNMAEEESLEVRKQHLLISYFEISSTKELKNYLAN